MKKLLQLFYFGLIVIACQNEFIQDKPIIVEEMNNFIASDKEKLLKSNQQPKITATSFDVMYLAAIFSSADTENFAHQLSYEIFYSMGLSCFLAQEVFQACLNNEQCVQQIINIDKYTFGLVKRYKGRPYHALFVDLLTCNREETIFTSGLKERPIFFCHNPFHRLTLFGL